MLFSRLKLFLSLVVVFSLVLVLLFSSGCVTEQKDENGNVVLPTGIKKSCLIATKLPTGYLLVQSGKYDSYFKNHVFDNKDYFDPLTKHYIDIMSVSLVSAWRDADEIYKQLKEIHEKCGDLDLFTDHSYLLSKRDQIRTYFVDLNKSITTYHIASVLTLNSLKQTLEARKVKAIADTDLYDDYTRIVDNINTYM